MNYEKAIAIEPRLVPAYLGMAKAYDGLGQTEMALETYDKGIEVVEKVEKEESIALTQGDELYIEKATLVIRETEDFEEALSILEPGYEVTESEKIKDMIEWIKNEMNKDENWDEEQEQGEMSSEEILQEGQKRELTEEEKEYLKRLEEAMKKGEAALEEVYGLLVDEMFFTLLDGMHGGADYFYDGVEVIGLSGTLDAAGLVIRQGIDRVEGVRKPDESDVADENEAVESDEQEILAENLGWEVYYGNLKYGKPDGTGFAAGVDYSDGTGTLLFHLGDWKEGFPEGEGRTGFIRVDFQNENSEQLDLSDVKQSVFVRGLCVGTVKVELLSYDNRTEEFQLAAENGQIIKDDAWVEDTGNYFEEADFYLPGVKGNFVLLYDDTNNDVCTRTVFMAERYK